MRTLFTLICVVIIATTQAVLVNKTIIEWSRQIRTCDTAGDNDIAITGTTHVVYAHNDDQLISTLTDDNAPTYHGPDTRGSNEINFADAANETASDPQQSVVAFTTRPVALPNIQTYYHCQGFKYDWGTTKLHAIKVSPSINFTNRAFAHHILLQVCTIPLNDTDLAWSGNCYGGEMPLNLQKCDQKSLFAGWAVGGGPVIIPPQAGIPVKGVAYYMMQIHYNNPSLISGVTDSIGMNVTVTPNLRPNDAACLEVLRQYSSISIPPGNSSFVVESYADHFELARNIGSLPDNIYIFATFLHMHLLGRQMRVSHFDKNGTYVNDIDYNPQYDFNFQQTVGIPPYKFTYTDKIKMECTYDSTGVSITTIGGTATTNEMCQAYLYYYPASPDPLTVMLSYPANLAQYTVVLTDGVYPTFIVGGGTQSGLGGGNYTLHVDTPPIVPANCSTTHNSAYTVGTADTQFLPISSFNPAMYQNSKVLDTIGKYKLYWTTTINESTGNGVVEFAAEVETFGWLGFGISPNGDMTGSDIALGWVDTTQNKVTLTDRKATQEAQPGIDPSQDIFNVRGYKGLYEQTPPDYGEIYYNTPADSTPSGTTGTTAPPGATTTIGIPTTTPGTTGTTGQTGQTGTTGTTGTTGQTGQTGTTGETGITTTTAGAISIPSVVFAVVILVLLVVNM